MLTREDPFYSSKFSINRGKQRTLDFSKSARGFVESNPYAFVSEVDPDSNYEVHKIKMVKPMPESIEGEAVEAANHLRSALDQAMFAIGGKGAYFPIAHNLSDFEKGVKGRCKNIPVEITDIVRRFKPYRGGNDLLWALNEVANTQKHGVIVPIAMQPVSVRSGNISISRHTGENGPILIGKSPVWDFVKNEMEVNRFPLGVKYVMEANPEMTYFIAMHGIPIVERKDAVTILNAFVGIVENIVMALEVEAIRLRLVQMFDSHLSSFKGKQ